MEDHEKKPVRPRCIPQIVSPKWLTSTEKVGFLDLSGEIRNKIYRLVLVQHPGRRGCEHLLSSLAPPALTLVNKQTFAEALPIFYAENTFYLLLWAKREGLSDQDPTDFHRFTRMVEYFGRPTTSTKDQNPMRYIKNIVVQIRNSADFDTAMSPPIRRSTIYNNLCIRGEQETITYTSDPETREEVFNPTNYRWNVSDVIFRDSSLLFIVFEARKLLEMSFTAQVQPISWDVTYLVSALLRRGENEEYGWASETSEDSYL